MSVVALLALLLLFSQNKLRYDLHSPTTLPAIKKAAAAQRHAQKTAARAAQTNHPADHAAAAKAATTAAVLTNHAAQQAKHAANVPPPWPAVQPKGLPPWPAGWKPAHPPPAPVVARAWQLLPILWKKGSGAKAVEQTAGRWYTYVATPMPKGVKGVTAWQPKAEPVSPTPRDHAAANA